MENNASNLQKQKQKQKHFTCQFFYSFILCSTVDLIWIVLDSGYAPMETPDTTSQVDNEGRMTFWTTELPEIIRHEFSHDLNFTIGLQK